MLEDTVLSLELLLTSSWLSDTEKHLQVVLKEDQVSSVDIRLS